MTNVWVVEDNDPLREEYAQWLGAPSRGLDVQTFATPREVDDAVTVETAPDGMILDYSLPGESGVDLLARHELYLRPTHVWVVTGHADAGMSLRVRKLGAHLLIKPASPELFIEFAAVVHARAAVRRAPSLPPRVAQQLAGFAQRWRLSVRQTEALVLFARGYRAKEVASELKISEETVRKHVRAILKRSHLESMRDVLRQLWTLID